MVKQDLHKTIQDELNKLFSQKEIKNVIRIRDHLYGCDICQRHFDQLAALDQAIHGKGDGPSSFELAFSRALFEARLHSEGVELEPLGWAARWRARFARPLRDGLWPALFVGAGLTTLIFLSPLLPTSQISPASLAEHDLPLGSAPPKERLRGGNTLLNPLQIHCAQKDGFRPEMARRVECGVGEELLAVLNWSEVPIGLDVVDLVLVHPQGAPQPWLSAYRTPQPPKSLPIGEARLLQSEDIGRWLLLARLMPKGVEGAPLSQETEAWARRILDESLASDRLIPEALMRPLNGEGWVFLKIVTISPSDH